MNPRGRKPGEFNRMLSQISNRNLKPIRPHKFKDDKAGKLVRVLFPLAVKIFDLPETLIGSLNCLPSTKAREKESKRIISMVKDSWTTLQGVYKLDSEWKEKLENDLEIGYKAGEYCREELYEKLLKSIFEYLSNQVKGRQNSLRANQEDPNRTFSFDILSAGDIADVNPDFDSLYANQTTLKYQNE